MAEIPPLAPENHVVVELTMPEWEADELELIKQGNPRIITVAKDEEGNEYCIEMPQHLT